jgi:lipoic acid synthetase
MLGLGETDAEVRAALLDLRAAGADLLTLGQYLRPTNAGRHLEVTRYVPPEEFAAWGEKARGLGFRHVASGPFVRSSFHAADAFPSK